MADSSVSPQKLVLTPTYTDRLVVREAVDGFAACGWLTESREATFFTDGRLARLFALPPERSGFTAWPDLFFSVNFHGLDKDGAAAAIFETHGIPLAVWCVDNPWNLLSGLRSDFWKRVHLFVTDDSFVPGLMDHGARQVRHLPLAAAPVPQPFAPSSGQAVAPLVFVGRSAFPDKERFFVGQKVDEDLLAEAKTLLAQGKRPDFAWWRARAGDGKNLPLWPGSAARRAALGAELCSAAWRALCLEAIPPQDLTVFGDAGWGDILRKDTDAPRDIRPPVDYYGTLPRLYADAEFSLNVTSLLLPRGLTQRHFDVWNAGGFLLTDRTPGLDLFPPALTEPVAFSLPQEIPARMAYFHAHPDEKKTLALAWRQEISANHSYARRMESLLGSIFSAGGKDAPLR